MVKPLFNAEDDEWVTMVGRYVLNMGALEAATRLLIVAIDGTDATPIFSGSLSSRIGFLRKRFPRADQMRHKWAMNTFMVAERHAAFRNVVCHSPLAVTGRSDGTFHINGILNLQPCDPQNVAELVTLEELKGRVNESAAASRSLLEMQDDFGKLGG
jgi:hypothetical protein